MPVRPVRTRHWTKTPRWYLKRLAINLANGVRAAAPVVDLGRLTGIDTREFQQGQTADRVLGEFDAPPDHARAGPGRAVLDHQRGPMRCRLCRGMPENGA